MLLQDWAEYTDTALVTLIRQLLAHYGFWDYQDHAAAEQRRSRYTAGVDPNCARQWSGPISGDLVFGDGAFDAHVAAAQMLIGWIVAVVPVGLADLDRDRSAYDLSLSEVTVDGVTGFLLDADGEPTSQTAVRTWEEIQHIYVY